MVTAIVLLKVSRDRVHGIAEELAAMNHISEVYSIAGRYDLATIVRAKHNEALEELITDQFLKVEGIISSETMIAFQVYSRHDLEAMFTIGQDE